MQSELMRLMNPYQGSKIIIEAIMQKTGKTLLAVSMILAYLDNHPNCYAYGNTPIKHKRYKFIKDLGKLSPKDFRKDREYIVFIDEGDMIFTWQKEYRNEGFYAFWGRGASHGKAIVIMTVQLEYQAMKRKLLRSTHIVVEKTIFDKNNIPISVVGYTTRPFASDFKQPVTNAINKYDQYERNISRIDFKAFRSNVEELDKNEEKTTTTRLHGNTRKAVKKIIETLVEDYGSKRAVARRTDLSRDFIDNIME